MISTPKNIYQKKDKIMKAVIAQTLLTLGSLCTLSLSGFAAKNNEITMAVVGEQTTGDNLYNIASSSRNFQGPIESLLKKILKKINYKQSSDLDWASIIAQHLKIPSKQVATTTTLGSSGKDLSRQFDDINSLEQTPEYIFILLSHQDLCALHPSMISNTDEIKTKLRQALRYFIKNIKTTNKVKLFVGGYLGITQFYNEDILQMEHKTKEGKSKSCNKTRNTIPNLIFEDEQTDREKTLEKIQLLAHPARVCPTIFSPKAMANSNLGFFERIFSSSDKQKRKQLTDAHMTMIATKSRAIKQAWAQVVAEMIKPAQKKSIEIIFVSETSEINWQEKDKKDCFSDFSPQGHEKIAQAFIEKIPAQN
jgi:hypothetical protein